MIPSSPSSDGARKVGGKEFCGECGVEMPARASFCPACGFAAIGGTAPSGAMETLGGMVTLGGEETRGRSSGSSAEILAPGTRFADRYQIEACVGAGGMGVVYRAKDSLTDKIVALKLIRPERMGGPGEVRRLIAEGVTARDIRHPNVVAVYDVGEVEGQPFLSMEYIEGRSLRAWHRSRKEAGDGVPLAIAKNLILGIANGLRAAHEAGVVHRDLKPDNIMLVADPTVNVAPLKILDFGIAIASGRAGGTGTGTGSAAGTPRYMAPEQVTEADLAGPSADLYALSVMFYELLVGVLPQGHWQPPSGGRSDVPEAVDDLIQRGLSNRAENRPQSATEYGDTLLSATRAKAGVGGWLLDRWPSGGRSVGTWSPVKGWTRKKTGWAVAGIILLAAAASESFEASTRFGDSIDGAEIVHAFGSAPRDAELANGAEEPREAALEGRGLPGLSELSGMWFDGHGGGYDVGVDDDGDIYGDGLSREGLQLTFEGHLSGRSLTYRIDVAGEAFGSGGGRWDGVDHIAYQTRNPDGSVNLGGHFHINHEYRSSCP